MAERGLGKGLGAGLGALFGGDVLDEPAGDALVLPITRVEPNISQPRSNFDEAALEELAESLRNYGMIQPITVRKLDSGYYQIIAGERRWRAARRAGLKEVPVRVIEADDRRATELALVENLQREDLNPLEEARGYKTLIEEFGLTQEEAAISVGKSRPAVANALRLLGLAEPVQKLVEEGKLSAGHARALIPIRDAAQQLSAAKTVIERSLSVRQTETLASRVCKSLKENRPETPRGIMVNYLEEVEKGLTQALGRKVKITDNRKKGKIELEYYGSDDMETLISSLKALGRIRGGGKGDTI
jgi:ParB family chromosome partitioning protein